MFVTSDDDGFKSFNGTYRHNVYDMNIFFLSLWNHSAVKYNLTDKGVRWVTTP